MNKFICEAVKEDDLKFICNKVVGLDETKDYIRLVNDFKKQCFHGILCKSEINHEILGFFLYYYSYSTWEARVVYISFIYLVDNDLLKHAFQTLCFKLIKIAREMHCSRINYNLNIIKDPKLEGLFVESDVKAVNLTKLENWVFFCMDFNVLEKFALTDKDKFEIN